MNLLRNAIKSHVSVRTIKPTHALPSFFREPPNRINNNRRWRKLPSINSLIPPAKFTPSKHFLGFAYGKPFGATKYTMKSDIISLLEECNLTPDDIKVSYNRNFFPVAMMLRFPSSAAFSNATRTIRRFDRLYRLNRVDASDWDIVTPYNGKTVVLQGLPRSAAFEDIERFLSGCDYDSSSV
ncbi:hypothetical protein V6N13_140817 [Hibiscus sabdariffa]|uniref:Uncharacterized protein n=1 Tax=Hibiscus sabdariffa TaxID=183260 RepID=A0ABR2Q274_9ROSI